MRCCVYVKAVLIGFALLSLTACMMSSLNLREGIHSFKVQNYREAFIRLIPEAEKGCPDAQYAVGYMYYYGEGVVEDKQKAWYWIRAAAKANQPDALTAIKVLKQGEARDPYSQASQANKPRV